MKERGRSDCMSKKITVTNTNDRIAWIDVLKFIGMFFIYIGHFGKDAGMFYTYAFQFHVPLFFFVSGFFFKNDSTERFSDFIKKKFVRYMIPYFVFNIIYIVIHCIVHQYGISFICNQIFKSFLGVRNNLLAGSTWFIPCLFVVEIVFYLLNRILKRKKILLLGSSLLLYIFMIYFSSNNPIINPTMFWNIDSALVYLLYFSIGNISFKYLAKYPSFFSGKRKFITYILMIITFVINIICFFKGRSILGEFLIGKYYFIYDIFFTLILIMGNVIIAILLRNFKLLQSIGTETLYLCLTENLVKLLVSNIFLFLGINMNFANPLIVLFYSFGLIYFNWKFFIPFIKMIKLRCSNEVGTNKCSL